VDCGLVDGDGADVVTGGRAMRWCDRWCDPGSVGPGELVHPAARAAAAAVAATAQTRTSTPISLAQPPPDYAEAHPDGKD